MKTILTYARLISGNYIFNKDVFELFEKWKSANRIKCVTAKIIGGGSGHIIFSTNPMLTAAEGDAWSTVSLNGLDTTGQIRPLEEFAHQITNVKQLRVQPKDIHSEIALYLKRLSPKRLPKTKPNTFVLVTVSLSKDMRELTIKVLAESCKHASTQRSFFESSKIRGLVGFYATSRRLDVEINSRLFKQSHIRPETIVRRRKSEEVPQLDLLETNVHSLPYTIPPELTVALKLVRGQQILDALKKEGLTEELLSLTERWMTVNNIL